MLNFLFQRKKIEEKNEVFKEEPEKQISQEQISEEEPQEESYGDEKIRLQQIIDLDNEDLEARFGLAAIAIKEGHIKEGIVEYKDIARLYLEKEDIRKALEIYKRVTILQPDDTESHLTKGEIYKKLGELEDAKNAFRYVLRYDLSNVKALMELGEVSQQKGEVDSAILAYKKVLDINPELTIAHEHLGELYEIRGQDSEAVKHYTAAIERYNKDGLPDKALELNKKLDKFQIMINSNPNSHFPFQSHYLTLIAEGDNFTKEKNYASAIMKYQEAMKIKPDNLDLGRKLIEIFKNKGDYDRIISFYIKWSEKFPYEQSKNLLEECIDLISKLDIEDIKKKLPEVHKKLGILYFNNNEMEKSELNFKKILDFNTPDSEETLRYLSSIYESQGKLDEALFQYKEILRFKPDDARLYETIGHTYYRQNKSEDTINWYSQAGDLYVKQRDFDEGIRIYETILGIKPGVKDIIDKLNNIYYLSPVMRTRAVNDLKKELVKNKVTCGTMLSLGIKSPIPLKYTEVRAKITGGISGVRVIQKFYNNLDKNIEAIYAFPIPYGAAVDDMEVRIGERILKAIVKEKEEAFRNYEETREDMRKAVLLEQDTPGIFTFSVANIEPSQEVIVSLNYHHILKYENEKYTFIFPMTMGARYSAKKGEEEGPTQYGRFYNYADREINIFINLDAGFNPGEVYSPSHSLLQREKSLSVREIELSNEGEIPDRDFILIYAPKGEKLQTGISCYRKEGKDGTFMFHIIPRMDYAPEEMVKREMIFVIDRSGSMSYRPMEQAKNALKSCLRTLRKGDYFSIITFDSIIEYLSYRKSIEFNEENLHKADDFINKISSRGGTEILEAMITALNIPEKKGYLRQIIFLTDGEVRNNEKIIEEVKKTLGKARIFTFGVGSSVNRYLLDNMAEIGRGTATYLTLDQDIEEVIQEFANQTSFPVLTDISLEWEKNCVKEIYPSTIPDLYGGQTIYLLGRYNYSGKVKIRFKGMTGRGEYKEALQVNLPEKDEEYPAIETIWVKKKIENLLNREKENPRERTFIREEVISLSMKYKLPGPYTSLIAIESKDGEEIEKDDIIRIEVPLILPKGHVTSRPGQQKAKSGMLSAPRGAMEATLRTSALRTMGEIKPRLISRRAGGNIRENIRGIVKPSSESFSFKTRLEEFEDTPSLGIEDDDENLTQLSSREDLSTPEIPDDVSQEMINSILKWLIRNQTAEGAWSQEGDINKKVLSTAFGLLTFIDQGHTNKKGSYKPQLSKVISYLENNLNNLSGLALIISSWVFFKLYDLNKRQKEKDNAFKFLEKFKNSWNNYSDDFEKYFSALVARDAVKSQLISEGEFRDIEERLSSVSGKEISQISSIEDFLYCFINLSKGNNNFQNLIKSNYDSGYISFRGLKTLDTTSIGGFIISSRGKV